MASKTLPGKARQEPEVVAERKRGLHITRLQSSFKVVGRNERNAAVLSLLLDFLVELIFAFFWLVQHACSQHAVALLQMDGKAIHIVQSWLIAKLP